MGICSWVCKKINKSIKDLSKSKCIDIVDVPEISNASCLSHLSTIIPFESLLCHASQNYCNLINALKNEGITADHLPLPVCKDVVDYCMDANLGLIILLSEPSNPKWNSSKQILNGASLQSRITTDEQYLTIQSTVDDHKYNLSKLRACASSMHVSKNLAEILTKCSHSLIRQICAPYVEKLDANILKKYYFSKVYSKNMHSIIKDLPQDSFLYTAIKISEKDDLFNLYYFLKSSYLLYSLMWGWDGYADWVTIDDFISKYRCTLTQNPLLKETVESLPYTKQEICSLILSNQLPATDYLVKH